MPDSTPPLEITLCMGSSCFARGNRAVLAALQQFLAKEGLESQVRLAGCRCANSCRQGPNLSLDGVAHHDVDPGSALDLLRAALAARGGEELRG